MHDSLNTHIKETFEISLCQNISLFAEKETLFVFKPKTLPVECSMCPVECSMCHVECSIDFGHLKFLLGLILTTILTPRVGK